MLLLSGHIVLGKNCLHRTLGHTQGAINAFFWVNHQKIRTFVETVHRANIYTVGVFTLDAAFGYNISHGGSSSRLSSADPNILLYPKLYKHHYNSTVSTNHDSLPRFYQDHRGRQLSRLTT